MHVYSRIHTQRYTHIYIWSCILCCCFSCAVFTGSNVYARIFTYTHTHTHTHTLNARIFTCTHIDTHHKYICICIHCLYFPCAVFTGICTYNQVYTHTHALTYLVICICSYSARVCIFSHMCISIFSHMCISIFSHICICSYSLSSRVCLFGLCLSRAFVTHTYVYMDTHLQTDV